MATVTETGSCSSQLESSGRRAVPPAPVRAPRLLDGLARTWTARGPCGT